MRSSYAYDDSAKALLTPALDASFFEHWTPEDVISATGDGPFDALCAEMSRLAYASEETTRACLPNIGFELRHFFQSTGAKVTLLKKGTQGFVAWSKSLRLCVIAFRGTESGKIEDFIADACIAQVRLDEDANVLAHQGFLEHFKVVQPDIEQTMQSIRSECATPTVVVTGHSLGAALATLAAWFMKADWLVTFGSPRPGNASFCRALEARMPDRIRRYINCCDLVTRVPPVELTKEHLVQLVDEIFPSALNGWALAPRNLLLGLVTQVVGNFAGKPLYDHVTRGLYIGEAGEVLGNASDAIRTEDCNHARVGFREVVSHLPFLEDLKRIIAMTADAARGRTIARDFADHAPINYVSAFTGRSR